MKIYIKVLFVLILMLTTVCASAQTWSTMSQAQKNIAILSYAMTFTNGTYGGQCKVWVNNVVKGVSGKTLPATAASPYDYKWLVSSNVIKRTIAHSGLMAAGDIVQMKLLSNGIPHTAIVIGVYQGAPGEISFIDSNWFGYKGSDYVERVYVHTMTIPDFNKKVGTQFSVYNIK
ncbi:MAG: hypothetical protein RLZZ230_741 [Candidatus Parcubacteria bacterium]|jgi:hypothetical protein